MDYLKNNVVVAIVVLLFILEETRGMGAEEKEALRLQTMEMFNHAYYSYMNNAYPADELMPLSCKGRWRGSEASRGDIDDCLGNFTLTLIDSLDTLAILGNIDELDRALRLIIKDAKFDADIIVSVFETNIRILGGLLGGHVAATVLKKKHSKLHWYNNELLNMAREVGDRLLPAFNTTTGIPYPRINLKHGLSPDILDQYKDTCTACAGTMILEFAALSRLTGLAVYEEKAHKAMDYLWQQRHRGSDLMGTVINIHNGDWVRRESGVGAGIDSYYEYMLKAYILLGDDTYLDRFNKHYDAVMKYVSQGPLLVDVHMHKPMANSRNFMDALLAFWPGLQVLKGDIRPAIQTHEMLYQIIQRHNFLPEAFTTDFRIHWGHHPLRPEFVESNYFLYKATGDPYYLEVGKKVIENLNAHARVRCGFAAIKDLTTGVHEDQMDSYVLAETFKYLYLLFSEREHLAFDVDNFIFTTEAHLLPLSLSLTNFTQTGTLRLKPVGSSVTLDLLGSGGEGGAGVVMEEEAHNTCPNLQHAAPGGARTFAHNLRSQMKDMVERLSPKPRRDRPRLRAVDFIAGNKEQLEQLHQMGIRIATMADGRIQLLHTASEAASPQDAEDGMLFMQEMIVISQNQQPDHQHTPVFIQVVTQPFFGSLYFKAGPAQFGYDLKTQPPVQGEMAVAVPFKACLELENPAVVRGKVALVERGDCMFVDKARNLQRAGAIGGIVVDHTEGSTSETQALFAMSGDGQGDIRIPMGFIFHKEAQQIFNAMELWPGTKVQFSSEIFPEDAFRPTPREASSDTQAEQVLTPEENVAAASHDIYDHQAVSVSTQGNRVHMQVRVGGDPPLAEQDPAKHKPEQKPDAAPAQWSAPSQRTLGSSMLDEVLQLNVLPDGSRTLTFQLDDANTVASTTRPQLHQLYVDLVQLLQERTNFGQLAQQSEYLVAVARLLEAAYFRFDKVDSAAQEAIRNLASELRFLPPHQVKDATVSGLDSKPSETAQSGTSQGSAKEVPPTRHFAQPEELEAVGEQAQGDSGDDRRWVKLTEQGKDGGHGALVGEDGVLRFMDPRDDVQQQYQQQHHRQQASHSTMDASQADHVASQHSGAPSQTEEVQQGREPHQHGSPAGSSQGGSGEEGSQGFMVNERTSAPSGLVAGTNEQAQRREEL